MDYIFDQADIDGNGLLKTKELQYSSFLVADLLLKEGLAALARVGRDPHLGAVGGGGGARQIGSHISGLYRSVSEPLARPPSARQPSRSTDPLIHPSTCPTSDPHI